MKQIFVLLLLCATFGDFAAQDAEAGVLLRSRVRARNRNRVQSSTFAMRKTLPAFTRVEPIGTVRDDVRIQKMYAKYQRRLDRWENSRVKAEEKLARKRERERLREKREEEKKLRAFQRQHDKHARKKAYELREESQGHDVEEDSKITQSGKGGLVVEQDEKPKKRQSFWARFWNALTGRGGSAKEAPEAKSKETTKPAAVETKTVKKPATEAARGPKKTVETKASETSQSAQSEEDSTSIHDRLFAPRSR